MRITLRGLVLAVGLFAVDALAQEGNARAEAIAKANPTAKASFDFIQAQAARIKDPALKKAVQELLKNPAPTFMTALGDAAAREKVRQALVDAKLMDGAKWATADAVFPPVASTPSFLAAPGGGHHGYPGGLAEHTAFNLQSALDLESNYRRRYGITDLDHDLVIAAPILHDSMKPWLAQWRADGTNVEQAWIAGTASHHIFIIAELLHRGLKADLVVTVAGAHDPPQLAEEKVAGYLRAGAMVAGVDPIAYGLLTAEGKLARMPPMEAGINHLADHDYVLSHPAEQAVVEALGGDRWTLVETQARVSGLALYAVLRARGPDAMRAMAAAAMKKR